METIAIDNIIRESAYTSNTRTIYRTLYKNIHYRMFKTNINYNNAKL